MFGVPHDGVLAGCAGIVVGHPFDTVKVRMFIVACLYVA